MTTTTHTHNHWVRKTNDLFRLSILLASDAGPVSVQVIAKLIYLRVLWLSCERACECEGQGVRASVIISQSLCVYIACTEEMQCTASVRNLWFSHRCEPQATHRYASACAWFMPQARAARTVNAAYMILIEITFQNHHNAKLAHNVM